eukprot:3809805-Rhodomonas_salina.2
MFRERVKSLGRNAAKNDRIDARNEGLAAMNGTVPSQTSQHNQPEPTPPATTIPTSHEKHQKKKKKDLQVTIACTLVPAHAPDALPGPGGPDEHHARDGRRGLRELQASALHVW